MLGFKGLRGIFIVTVRCGCFVGLQEKLWEEPCMEKPDQYQYLSNCSPTPPLTQQQSIDDKLGLMLG